MKNVLLFLCFLIISNSNAQDFCGLYDQVITNNNEIDSYQNMMKKARSGNASEFIYLSIFLNSNNMMFKKNGQKKYLQYNNDIINEVTKSQAMQTSNRAKGWVAQFEKGHRNGVMNGKQYMLYEAYLFRYIAEYEYIRSRSVFGSAFKTVLPLLEEEFEKWQKISKSEYGDNSLFMDSRLHIGSHWATFAQFSYKLTNESKYLQLYSVYDKLLRTNLSKVKSGANYIYQWSSVYNSDYYKYFSMKITNKKEIQDVSHGNHIVQYVITAYELGSQEWTKNDLQLLANTLKYKIWNNKAKQFSDLTSGTNTNDASYKNTGRNQSDGWMKLMKYDSSLSSIYLNFYNNNRRLIDKTYLNLQFYANMCYSK